MKFASRRRPTHPAIAKHSKYSHGSAWFATLLVWLSCQSVAFAQEYAVGTAGQWVVPVNYSDTKTSAGSEASRGINYILVDEQVRLAKEGKERYRHFVSRAVNEQGVGSIASIQIGFDPSYQKLVLHDVNVIRNGKVIPKLKTSRIQVLQRELELEYQTYDGSKTLNIELVDVRIGDTVEYAYTIKGSNPVFQNKSSGEFAFQWEIPVQQLSYRLLAPTDRIIYFTRRNSAPAASIKQLSDFSEYSWQQSKLHPLIVDDDSPGWFDPYPVVQWSEFENWRAVAEWAVPNFDPPAKLTPPLQAELKKIEQQSQSPEQRMLSTLQFVQREIRYLGIEIGAGSHKPNSPDLVLNRRFGDCKDKALLTVTLLRALGIDAKVALVNTRMRKEIAGMQASPNVFDHAIVKVRINEKDFWIDPTRQPQRGSLLDLYQPNYGLALVVDAASQDLTAFSGSLAATNKRVIQTTFDTSAGLDKPVRLIVKTVATGAGADSVRDQFESSSIAEMQKNYLNFYAGYYDEIDTEKPLEISDSDTRNEITITEHYLINNFWPSKKGSSKIQADFHVPDMMDYIKSPENRIRTSPLATHHPLEISVETQIRLPETWDIKSKKIEIDDSAFRFEHHQSIDKKVINMTDHLISKADFVSAPAMNKYAKDIDAARDVVGISLYKDNAAKEPARKASFFEKINWMLVLLGVFSLYVWTRLAAYLYKLNPRRDTAILDRDPRGFGGWLLLASIGIFLLPVRIISNMKDVISVLDQQTWSALTTVGHETYNVLWAPTLILELVGNLGMLVLSLLLICLLLQKRTNFPKVYMIAMGLVILFRIADMYLASMLPATIEVASEKDWTTLGVNIVVTIIWIAYFQISKRVNATFTQEFVPRLQRSEQ